MLQVQKPGTCGWPLTGCQAAATFTGASCAARSWRTSGTTTTSTSPAGLSVLSVVPLTRVATTCAHTLNSNTPKQEKLILTILWPARWRYRPRITILWIRSPKELAGSLPRSILMIVMIVTRVWIRIVIFVVVVIVSDLVFVFVVDGVFVVIHPSAQLRARVRRVASQRRAGILISL